ncbi:hypothetical protein MetMK1DRAFT_00012880 [Metallosphaera yellowstonensis MK1]|uniref:inosine/xanthosine triphosphatase n=1 Tax=Metallosphaera yellowstonensis MK1 TaxID=671065 RepID=H2C3G4_9CREN|nr:inosine/xanthosine triphosphatase [Metallosphaera yellowstonensis]EHP70785.1 hypothetical protein MetMK1DRAFT_00012880 [Metallosphaera yellowstonensis MK1]
MLVCVGSTNGVKVEAVREALMEVLPNAEVKTLSVDSEVSPQPWCHETYSGARNRALKSLQEGCDIGVGIEGGVCVERNRVLAFAVIYAVGRDGTENFSTSPWFVLPPSLASKLFEGKELGEATDLVYGRVGSKYHKGAVGILSKVIDRRRLYKDAVILALYPFYNREIGER